MKMRLALSKVAVGLALLLAATAVGQTYVELILDASGSMYNTLDDGRYRIVAAKEVLSGFIAGLPSDPDLNVGLRVYGSELQATHRDACTDSRLFVPLQGVDRTALLSTVDTVLARGATPIAWSLQQAGADFTQPGRNIIVLVTDGEESCGGDISQVMADLAAAGIDIDLRIIGFDLTEQASLSFAGVGTFENARTAAELAAALGRAVEKAVAVESEQLHEVKVTLTRAGEPVTEGAVLNFSVSGADSVRFQPADGVWRAELPAGNYAASIEDAHSEEPLTVTGLRVLPGAANTFSFELAPESMVTLSVPDGRATIGQELVISWSGAPGNGEHWITVVPVAAADDAHGPGAWVSGSSGDVAVLLSGSAGELQARFLLSLPEGGSVLAGRSATFIAGTPEVTLTVPAEVAASSEFSVSWDTAAGPLDFVTVVPAGAPAGEIGNWFWPEGISSVIVRAPDDPGAWEVRYMSEHSGDAVLGSAPLTVADAGFALLAPAVVTAGTPLEVTWRGPGAEYDYVAISRAGSEPGGYLEYRYLSDGNPLSFTAPGTPGDYELRYANDSASDIVLFSVPFTVEAADITLSAPDSVAAGSSFEVAFTVTDRAEWDYITIVPAGAEDGAWLDYVYVYDESTVTLTAPDEPAEYEIRYASDSRLGTFARRPIQVR